MRHTLSLFAVLTVAGCGAMPTDPGASPLAPEAVKLRAAPTGAATLPSCKGVDTRGRVAITALPGGAFRVDVDGAPVCEDTAQGVIAAGLDDESGLAAALSGPGTHPRITYSGPGSSDPMPADGQHDGVDGTGLGGGGKTSSDPMPATGK